WERETGAARPGLRDRGGDERRDVTGQRSGDGRLEVTDLRGAGALVGSAGREPVAGGTADREVRWEGDAHRTRAALERIAIAEDDRVGEDGRRCGGERRGHDLRSDAGGVTEGE